MGRIILSFPAKFFTTTFLESIVKNNLGITGDDLPLYLNEKVSRNGRVFSPDIIYICKRVNNNVTMIGVNMNN